MYACFHVGKLENKGYTSSCYCPASLFGKQFRGKYQNGSLVHKLFTLLLDKSNL